MRFFRKLVFTAITLLCSVHAMHAQDLAPRAYIISPIHSNAVTLTYTYFSGDIILNSALPLTGANAGVSVAIFNFAHSMNFFGRTANVLVVVPYAVGNFRGTVAETPANAYRSGLVDSEVRFSVNLIGGPAMDVREFSKWRQKTLLGVSLRVVVPTGQYDPTRLINYGANRWAFRPEVGLSRRQGRWTIDAYGAVWFFTTNPEFFSRNRFNPGVTAQSESPVGACEGHLSYEVKPRLWASLDGNFWYGGRTTLNGVENRSSLQRNSRVGTTVSVPLARHQSLKFSYSQGAYIRFGGNYKNVSAAWQYSWLGRPN